MVTSVLQIIGFVLGIVSWAGMIGTCAAPEWRKNSQGQTIIDKTLKYDGLWVRCKAFSTGQTQCLQYKALFIGINGHKQWPYAIVRALSDTYCRNPAIDEVLHRIATQQESSFFAFTEKLTLYGSRLDHDFLRVCRILVIVSIGLGFIGIIITVFGLKCVRIGSASAKSKAILSLVGGLLIGIAAILTGAAVSYFAHGVVQEYYNPALTKERPLYLRFEYGYGLFIGWGSLVVGILGCTLICSASVAILVRRIDFTASTPHLHQLRPVPILQSASTIEPISMHVHSNSLGREHSNRQVRIRDPNPVQDGRRSQNGSVATRQSSNSSASRTNKTSVKRGRVPRQERSHHSRGRPEKGPSDAQSTQSASRAKRRRSYEASLERARSAPGQVKQYV